MEQRLANGIVQVLPGLSPLRRIGLMGGFFQIQMKLGFASEIVELIRLPMHPKRVDRPPALQTALVIDRVLIKQHLHFTLKPL